MIITHPEIGVCGLSCRFCPGYQKLEDDISFVQKNGVDAFEKAQKAREELLKEMLHEFNEGRSMSYYCIAAKVLDIDD